MIMHPSQARQWRYLALARLLAVSSQRLIHALATDGSASFRWRRIIPTTLHNHPTRQQPRTAILKGIQAVSSGEQRRNGEV